MNKKTFFRQYWLIFLAIFMILFATYSVFHHPTPTLQDPALKVSSPPFKQAISGIGEVEPQSEIIDIGTNLPGIVTKVYVTVGQEIKANDPLFSIDARDADARLKAAKAAFSSANAQLLKATHDLQTYQRIDDKRAISIEELTRRKDQVTINQALTAEALAKVDIIETEIARLTVRAPIAGKILKVAIHPGEYTNTVNGPLLILGDVRLMRVRVEFDASNAQKIKSASHAVGYLRDYQNQAIPLQFVRLEPLITTKKSLSNQGDEIIDTRVLIALYSFDNQHIDALSGQKMDVYIDAK
jgi:HlyD family secretion protein